MKKPFLGLLSVLTTVSWGQQVFSEDQKKALKDLIRQETKEYIASHPQDIHKALEKAAEMMQKEQSQEQKQQVLRMKDQVFSLKNALSLHVDPQTVNKAVVLFIDPYCGYCHKAFADLNKQKTAVLVRFVSLLGEGSALAVKALKAAAMQGKWVEMLQKISQASRTHTADQLRKMAEALGLNGEKFSNDMHHPREKEALAQQNTLMEALKISATPTYITYTGDVFEGYQPKFSESIKAIYEKK